MPIGPRAIVTFYRPPTTTDGFGNAVASVVPYGSESSGTSLGSFVIEDLTLDLNGTLIERMGTYGEDTDAALSRKRPSLNLTAQMAGAGTPTLCPGDYCAINIGMQASSTTGSPVSIPLSRWFLQGDSVAANQNQANKFGLKLHLDRQNSAPTLKEF